MRTKVFALSLSLLLLAAAAFGGRLSFEEHAAVQESLSRVHPRMRARWLKERGIEDPYYTSVRTDSGSGLECIGRWSYGPSYDVDGRTTPSETLVALARGSGVSLLRFSRQDSLSIELLSDINAEGLMCRVKVVDTLLYVGSRRGLEIYNIANEQSPFRLSWTQIPLNDFALQDSLVYTISGDDSFRIYNVSNPASPVFRGACLDSGNLVSVSGNAAFLGDRWGLYVLDVSNPASPHRIGSWGSAVEQVQARGRLCYVTTFNPNVPGDITFHVLDVAVPSLPYQIGSLDSAGGNDLYLIDTLAYGAGETDFNELTVISVADSTRPRLIGSAATAGWSFGIWASGTAQETFVGCHWEGLQIYDTRNTSAPVRDTFLLGCDLSVDIHVDNDRAYVANGMAGLKILNVIDPTRPSTLGSYDTAGQGPSLASAVALDSFAYIGWPRPKFRALDVSNPAMSVYAGTCELFGYPQDMVIRDSLVYVAEMNRFQIVNVARPREPVLVGSCAGDGVSILLRDTFAYTAAGAIRVTNIARPDSPFVATTIDRSSWDLSIVDSILFCQPGPAIWYSLANPAVPVPIDSIDMGHWIVAMAAVNRTIYACSGPAYTTLYAISIADLHQPRVINQASLPYTVKRINYVAPYLYLSCWEAGAAIYETTSVGIDERPAESMQPACLRIWPNVTSGIVQFAVGATTRATELAVFDILGERLSNVRQQVSMKGGARNGILDLSRLAAGVYVVRVKSEGESFTAKVVKTNKR
jgi:hypothetical protein